MVAPAPSDKIFARAALARLLDQRRAAGATIVLTNGIFDLMHIGHLRYLHAARALGDALVVGVNADVSARRLKGPARPIVPEDERAEMLAGLACVDYVTIFSEDTAVDLVRALRPEVYVKGGDYTVSSGSGTGSAPDAPAKPLPEAAVVQAYGGRVVLMPYIPGHSTTELISRIVEGSQQT
jgi:rfaE bifunctional protein nucleotidyltransferase chain/domain